MTNLLDMGAQSPIEQRLIGGFMVAAANRNRSIVIVTRATWSMQQSRLIFESKGCVIRFGAPVGGLVIAPQARVGKYSVDFICAAGPQIAIECDGHDFHERTKEQADADTTRARFIERSLPMLRFTGSRIFRDPIACAEEIWDFIAERRERDQRR